MTMPFYKIVLGTAIFVMSNLAAVAQTNPIKPAYDFSLSREEKIKLAESAGPPEDRQAPVNLEPTCFDAEGSATTLLTRLFVEAQRAQGKNEDQIKADLDEGYRTGKFLAPRKPGIVYMVSDLGFLLVPTANKLVRIPPHLMFYAPYVTDKDIGSPPSVRNMPKVIRAGQPDAYIIVMAPSEGMR